MDQIRLKRSLLAFLCMDFFQATLLLGSLLLLEGLCSLVQFLESGRLPAIGRQELGALAQLWTGCLALLIFTLSDFPGFSLPFSPLLNLLLIVSLHEALNLCLLRPFLGEGW